MLLATDALPRFTIAEILIVALDRDQAIPVVLDLMHPLLAFRWPRHLGWNARLNEAGRLQAGWREPNVRQSHPGLGAIAGGPTERSIAARRSEPSCQRQARASW